jgi:integrase
MGFHDLRHTAATRLVGGTFPCRRLAAALGHSQANTTYRYVNANVETAKRAAAALDAFSAEATEAAPPAELVHCMRCSVKLQR